MYSIENFRMFNVCCFSDLRTFFNSELLSIYGNTLLLQRISKPTMIEIGTTILTKGHCKFNDARPYSHIRETIPLHFQQNFTTLLAPSINIHRFNVSNDEALPFSFFSDSLTHSIPSNQLV